ncbi:hypothetical protein IFM89_037524 [Coptis chinensis]|uniref:Uncharacterized protein n=1 Tax=Coptis chinensis TaxID=261450 RepID=A0A835HZF4_9MAGN|nr:hypothetical protein IFM89_037524 [Coptis chinensis]
MLDEPLGRDIPNESSKNPRFNSLKVCNAQSSLLSTHNADVFEKPLSQHRSLSKKHNYSATTPEHETAPILEDDHSISFQNGLMKKLDIIQRFCRPFLVVGTAIGASSISLLPLETISELTPIFLIGVLMALTSVAIMEIYMNGINELFDVEIDKV